jgi:hypothetical protein
MNTHGDHESRTATLPFEAFRRTPRARNCRRSACSIDKASGLVTGALHMVKFCGIAFLIIVLCFLCLSAPAAAEPLPGVGGTTVTVDGTTVTIHVQIEVFGLEGVKIT